MSSLASLVASIDERLAAVRGEIDRLQHTRAALISNPALANGAGDLRTRATRAPRATVVGATAHRAKAGPRPGPETRVARPAEPPARPHRRRAHQRIAPLTAATIEHLLSGRDTGLSARAIAEHATADYAATLSLYVSWRPPGRSGARAHAAPLRGG
jgi:hypothetical protein